MTQRILRLIAFGSFVIICQLAQADQVTQKSYGNVQGATVMVMSEQNEPIAVTLYRKGDEFTFEFARAAAESGSISTVGIQDYNASYDLRLRAHYQQMNAARAAVNGIDKMEDNGTLTGGDAREMGIIATLIALPFDLVASPFVAAGNVLHRTGDPSAKCAHETLELMRDSSKIGTKVSVPRECMNYLMQNVQG